MEISILKRMESKPEFSHIVLILPLILLSFFGLAQNADYTSRFVFEDSVLNQLSISGNFSANSNSLTNSLVSTALQGGKITSEMKSNNLERIKTENRFGYLIENKINYSRKLKSHQLVAQAEYREVDFGNALFSEDFFKLVIYGNKPYSGEQLELNEFEFTRRSYQVFSLGLGKSIDSNLFISARVGLVHGSSFQTIQLHNANFYTEEDGRYIDFSGDYSNASSISNSRYSGNAWGTSLSLGVNKVFEKSGNELRLTLTDLGFAKWQQVSFYDTTDAKYRFEGYVIDDIFNAENGSDTQQDSVETVEDVLNLEKKETTLLVSLPTRIQIDFLQKFGKIELQSGFKYIFNANYIPRLYIQPKYFINEKIAAKATIAVGGYGNFDLGLGLTGRIGKSLYFDLDLYYLEALLVPNKSAGQGINFSLTKQF